MTRTVSGKAIRPHGSMLRLASAGLRAQKWDVMVVPLVATKLNLPVPRPRLVGRPRLRVLLDRGLEARLTLISAPAGFGKTTLLGDWLAGLPRPGPAIAWLSLDESDNEPSAFWPHVVAALQAGTARIGAHLPDLPSVLQPDRGFVALLVNQLAGGEVPVVLVLDDLHLVDRADIHEQLGFFVEHLPPHVHVVVSTRADPGLPLARLRVRGELVEIRSADLRFTAEEAAAYLNDVMHLGLSAADAATLEHKTEGWIAALQLAVLSLEGREDTSAFIDAFAGSGRYVVDYLVEEVLERLPGDLREFLMATAVLRRMNASLCDAVTGEPGSGRKMLDRLERQNLFLVPLDAHRQWFRYHHLFADVLRAHLGEAESAALPAIHRRASEWFEAHGERTEAIHHALEARDYQWAADLVELAVFDVQKLRQEHTIRTWMRALPDALVRTRPVLGIALVGVLASMGEFGELADRLRDVERGLAALASAADGGPQGIVVVDRGQLPRVPALVELYRAALAQARGDLPAVIGHARRVIDLAPPDDDLSRASASALLGIAHWTEGRLAQARAAWAESRDGLMRTGHVADTLGVSIALGDIDLALGRLREATGTFEHALGISGGAGGVLRGTADMHTGLAMMLRERNDLVAARRHLSLAAGLGEGAGLPQNPYRWRVADALLRQDEGDPDGARDSIDEAVRSYVADFFPEVRPVAAVRARILVAQGRLDDGARWQREAGVDADDAPSYRREYEHVTLARLLLARHLKGDADAGEAALPLLRRLLAAAGEGGRDGSVIEISILLALASRSDGSEAALPHLGRALALAAPEGHVRVFVGEGPAMEALLKVAVKRQIGADYAKRLLASFGAPAPKPPMHPELIEALSDRELEVLRLLASDLGGPEIARELAISENTMRTHTRNIYEKLGVNNRRAAVSRADELRLLTRRRG